MLRHQKPSDLNAGNAADMIHAELNAAGSIDAWLNVLTRLLHLPESQRQSIREELHEHLTERVRDLLLSGSSEADAVRTAIEELGETAQLARKFEAANRPRTRRLLMNLTVAAVTSGIVALGVVTLSPSTSPNTAQYAPWARIENPPAEIADAKFSITADASLTQALEEMAKQTRLGLIVNWGEIEQSNGNPDERLGLAFSETPVPTGLDRIAEAAGRGGMPLAWRVRDNGIEFGMKQNLDRREATLASYDISEVLESLNGSYGREYAEAVNDINKLLTQMVEPDSWRGNGGDTATINVVGGKMFIQAPPRMHQQVEWILQQLKEGGEVKAAANPQNVPLLADLPLVAAVAQGEAAKDALAQLRDALTAAQTNLDHVKSKFPPGTMQYELRKRELEAAQAAWQAAVNVTNR